MQRHMISFLTILTLVVGCGDFSFTKKEEEKKDSGSQNAAATSTSTSCEPNCQQQQPVASQSATVPNSAQNSAVNLVTQLIKGLDLNKILADPKLMAYIDVAKLQQLIVDKGGIDNLARDPNLVALILGILKPITNTSTSTSTSVNLVK